MSAPALASSVDELEARTKACDWERVGKELDQVGNAVARQNTEIPGGSFIAGPSEISMRTMGRLRTVEEFQKIVLAYNHGSAVTLGDVAGEAKAHRRISFSSSASWNGPKGSPI